VTLPTYLKYCESLGLTPAGRARLEEKKPEGDGGKLAKLRALSGRPAPKRLGVEEPRVFTPELRPLTPKTSLGFSAVEFAEDVLGIRCFRGRSGC
jgi:hypothetical protein